MTEDTLTAGSMRDISTLPHVLFDIKDSKCVSFPFPKGMLIKENVVLGMPLCRTGNSFLYHLVSGGIQEKVIKFMPKNTTLLSNQLARMNSPVLVPILEWGEWGEYRFEVYPLYENGDLNGVTFSEEEIKKKILPSLCEAIELIHRKKILHNDIKPSNIFWNNNKTGVVLGDYGCTAKMNFDKMKELGFSKEFADPEVLISNGGNRTAESDYYSLGMTIITLLKGVNPIQGKTINQILRIYENGKRWDLPCSVELKTLINSLLKKVPTSLEAIKEWCGIPEVYAVKKRHNENTVIPLIFTHEDNSQKYVISIPEMIDEIVNDWKYGIILLKNNDILRFITQFEPSYKDLLEECRESHSDEDIVLFKLLQSLLPTSKFCWKGIKYENLDAYAEILENDYDDYNAVSFFKTGMLRFYLVKNGADKEQIEFVERLEQIWNIDPNMAIMQLIASLNGDNVFKYKSYRFKNIDEFCLWLVSQGQNLDEIVDELLNSKKFEAWLGFQKCGDVIKQVNRRIARCRK